MRFIDQRFHLLFYKHNWQNGVFKNKNFNNKNLSLNITFLLHFYVSVSVYILCKLKLHIKHWQWHSILKIISLSFQRQNISVSISEVIGFQFLPLGMGKGLLLFFFSILRKEECSSMKSDNKNNSAVLVGRKHFLFQKSIGKESDPIFHLRQITITEQKSAHLVSRSDIYFHQPLFKVRSHT